jgi:methionyl-tRNA formyltransferase
MIIQILVDNKNSWYTPYALELKKTLSKNFESVFLIHDHSKVVEGDVLCILACEKKFKKLELNTNNIIVHESALPEGKGWSPLTWQILEGKNKISITLFEAQEEFDSGLVYLQEDIILTGNELLEEIKYLQGSLTNELIKKYISLYPNIRGIKQIGTSTFYKKRIPSDSELNINISLNEQFNQLRVVDNERYPAFFMKNDVKYILKIFKEIE